MAFQGVYTAIVTPFAEDGSVDWDELDRIVEFQIEGGVQGIVPCGTTGESPTLSHEEHRQVIERVTKKTAGRAHVMAGCGSNSTREAVGLTRHAAEIGVDSTLQVCPYYNKPSQEGMYRHFKAIAEATDKPIVLYNIPGRTGINMAPETIARLSELPTVQAVKEATASMDQASQILTQCDIDVLSGDDSLTLPLMALGGKGVVSVTSNILPKVMVELVGLIEARDLAAAQALHKRLVPVFKAMFCETNPSPVKAARKLLGLGSDNTRLPVLPATEGARATVRAALAGFGAL